MRIRSFATTLAAAVLVLAGCQADSLQASEIDNHGPPADNDASATPSCETCFGKNCWWESTECAGDPDCAHWMACARQCSPDVELQTPSSNCVSACTKPSTQTGQKLHDALAACTETYQCCAADINGASPDGGTWVPKEGGPTERIECASETCSGCVVLLRGPATASCPSAAGQCAATAEQCIGGSNDCSDFVVRFATCTSPDGTSTVPVEDCAREVPAATADTVVSMLGCLAKLCDRCVPTADEPCITCEVASCPDEMQALVQDVEAQKLWWCRRRCAAETNVAACESSCATQYPDGMPVLSTLGDCLSQRCASECGK